VLVAIAALGFAFTWWARVVLGRLWSSGVAVKADHDMITAGPYRLVRHPIYSGILLSVLATAAIRGTAAAVLGAALIILGLFVKARAEERFLRRELGDDRYASYARRVPMLVPFVH
jgi:protein-S-isoprenylcysteine O-methyltransferase Ste14